MNKALLIQAWLFIIGFLASNLHKRTFDPVFRSLIALPIGWSLFGVCATVVYSIYFAAGSQMILLVVLGLITVVLLVANIAQSDLSRDSMLLGGVSLIVLTGTCVFFDQLRIVTMSPDSSYIARFGQNMGLGNYEASRMMFSMWGPLVPFIHSITNLLDQKLFWQYQPVLSMNLIAVVFYTTYTVIREKKATVPSFGGAALLVSIMVLSNIFLFHVFYIHVNIISALYLYLFVFALLKMQQQPGRAYVWLALLSLIAFSLVRLEAFLFGITILLIATFRQEFSYTTRLKLIIPFVIFLVGWYARVYFMLPDRPDLLTKPLATIFILVLLGFGLFAALSDWKALRPIVKRAPVITVVALGVVSVVFTLVKPVDMLKSLESIGLNALFKGNWGLTWYLIGFLAIEIVLSRGEVATEHQWLFTVLGGYLLLVYNLAYFSDPYHVGEFDSANRLVLQGLPLVLLYLSTRIARLSEAVQVERANENAVSQRLAACP